MSSKLRVTSSGYGIPSPGHRFSRQRSSSLSSENSLTSESTITTSGNTSQYAHYGMTPVLYPSESTSASNASRSPSRLSDYSATSSQASHTSAIPRPPSKSHAASSSHHNTTTTNTRRLSDKLSNDTLRSSSRIASGSRINSNQSRLAKRNTCTFTFKSYCTTNSDSYHITFYWSLRHYTCIKWQQQQQYESTCKSCWCKDIEIKSYS